MLLADCTASAARPVAQKIVDCIGGIAFEWGGTTYSIGASVGIAPVMASAERDVLAMADAACYAAKAAGRGRIAASGD